MWSCFCLQTNCLTPNACIHWRVNFFIQVNEVPWKWELIQKCCHNVRYSSRTVALLQHKFSCASAKNTLTILSGHCDQFLAPVCCSPVELILWVLQRCHNSTALKNTSAAASLGAIKLSAFPSRWMWCNVVHNDLYLNAQKSFLVLR